MTYTRLSYKSIYLRNTSAGYLLAAVFTISASAQVPVFKNPQPSEFINYSENVIKGSLTPKNDYQYFNSPITNENQVYNPSAWMVQKYYSNPNASPEEQRRLADSDIRQYELQKKQQEDLNKEISSTFKEFEIEYTLPTFASP